MSLSMDSLEKIRSMADEVSRREGCELYDLEFSGHTKQRILRVYIDSDVASAGVEQCANVSRGLSLLLDVSDLIPGGAYELEVSTPGLDRVLRTPKHFSKAIGQEVKVITHEPVPELKGEVKSLSGQLLSAKEDAIEVDYQEHKIHLPLQNIKRAQVVFHFSKNGKR